MATIWVAPAMAQEKVLLRLSWDHQAQFAGYYAALWQGFYSDAGLDVEILSPFDGEGRVRPDVEVAEGRADFGIGGSNILAAIDGGAPLMIASPVFQHTGFGVLARAELGISSPADLIGLRVAKPTSVVSLAELTAMLAAEGIDPETMNWVESIPGQNGARLIDGEIDAFFSFEPASIPVLERGGLSITVLRPPTYGVDFYGDALFTSRALAESNPDLVSRFVAASLEGWHYAQEHPNEIADRISEDLTRQFPLDDIAEINRYMASRIPDLTLGPIIQLGNSNPDRWQGMYEALKVAGLVNGSFEYLKYVFDPEAEAAEQAKMFAKYLTNCFDCSRVPGRSISRLVMGLGPDGQGAHQIPRGKRKPLRTGRGRYGVRNLGFGCQDRHLVLLAAIFRTVGLRRRSNSPDVRRDFRPNPPRRQKAYRGSNKSAL